MLRQGLLDELLAPQAYVGLGWRQEEDGTWEVLRITDEGLHAIGVEVPEPIEVGTEPRELTAAAVERDLDLQHAAKVAYMPRRSLRDAAMAVVAAWEAQEGLEAALEALEATSGWLVRAHAAGGPRKPREGTKQAEVLTLLRRNEGATVAQIAEATGWAQHTVRGFFAWLKKGRAVEVMERIRQVGPNKEGARGSYTVYRVAG